MNIVTEIERASITQLKRDTADLLNRVCYSGERIVITSSGKERAALVSVGDLERLLRLPQNEEGKPQEIVARWLDQRLKEKLTWQELYLELIGVGGLLEQLGILPSPPPRGDDLERNEQIQSNLLASK